MAVVVGLVELFQVTVGVRLLDLGRVGYVVVALFVATWAVARVLECVARTGTLHCVKRPGTRFAYIDRP